MMRTAVDRFDWAATPLGPRRQWPKALAHAVQLALAAPFPMVVMGGPDCVIAAYNDAYRPLLGAKPMALGKPMVETWTEAADLIESEIKQALGGDMVRRERAAFKLMRGDVLEPAWFNYAFSPILDCDGETIGVLNIAQEITDQVRAEEDANILISELSHRVKNTLAVVSGLASLSFRGDVSASSPLRRFQTRLQSLSEAHDLLLEGDAVSTSLDALVRRALGHCKAGERLVLDGPDLTIAAGVATKLALVLSELCANALKHGALSGAHGEVTLTWRPKETDHGAGVLLEWRERGGPAVTPPEDGGLGLTLIERVLTGLPGSGADLRLEPDGARCDLVLPLAD